MSKKYSFTFPIEKDKTVSSPIDINSSDTQVEFSSDVFEWNNYVKNLDRYDSFAKLLIDSEQYGESVVQREPRICYGIPKKSEIQQGNSPILDHQKNAALTFLKELRGFGLLADVVGSGKTFEAGVALSELAARGKISSALFIVPEQVYGDWVRTMECYFGIGKKEVDWEKIKAKGEKEFQKEWDQFSQIPSVMKPLGGSVSNSDFKYINGFYIPNAPMIVTKENFVKWTEVDVQDKLFDIIVVDEAHFLNNTEGNNAKAMYLLSLLMQTKKEAAKRDGSKGQYCLLLSATPHNGNLADMFRLWYFIRFNGGIPECLNPKNNMEHLADRSSGNTDSSKTIESLSAFEEFNKERNYYLNTICVGAKTITDYVRKKKIIYVADEEKNEDTKITDIRKEFAKYLKDKNIKINVFSNNSESFKENVINQFLDLNFGYKEVIKHQISNDYHRDVLGTIMVRQPSSKVRISRAKKKAINLFYFHTDNKDILNGQTLKNVKSVLDSQSFDIDFNLNGISTLHNSTVYPKKGNSPKKRPDGSIITHKSLIEYAEDIRRNGETDSTKMIYAQLMKNIMEALSLSDNDCIINEQAPDYNYKFHRANSLSFFYDQLRYTNMNIDTDRCQSDVECSFKPIGKDLSNYEHKYQELCKILDKHSEERVVVFFDYTLPEDKSITNLVYERIRQDEKFKERVINIDNINLKSENRASDIQRLFNEKSNSIFIVTNEHFTEGANLQSAHIIVNMQITANPLDMQQRIGRVFRIGQNNDVLIYSIANLFDLEGYLLSYYTRIGLMNGNTGDAEILAGCNNDNMLAIRCKKAGCGFVQLLPKEDFESRTNHNCPECDAQNSMVEITTRILRCSNPDCDVKFKRSFNQTREQLYNCVSGNGYLITDASIDGGTNRKYSCSKVCVLLHCKKFSGSRRKTHCPVIEEYNKSKSLTGVELKCNASCKNFEQCKAKGCTIGQGITSCADCDNASCIPKPMELTFDNNWGTDCPKCRIGRIAPIKNSSFESFITELYQFVADGGASFCEVFQREIDKVSDIRDILQYEE